LDAVTGCIVPAGATPGAREAGAAWFIDRLVARWMPEMKAPVQDALTACQHGAVSRGGRDFGSLTPTDQDAVLAALAPDARRLLVQLTCAGLLCHPSHGGNRGTIGWQLVGHDAAMQFTPPYGYYDNPEHLSRLVAEAKAARLREVGR
jgi:hypothetical protein